MRTHTFIVRHFHTVNENVVYDGIYDEGRPYVSIISKYITKHNIKEIEFKTSDTPRTITTSMVLNRLFIERFPQLKINRVETYEALTRDPKRVRCQEISDHFKNLNSQTVVNEDEHKLVIYITHSSCYKPIYKGLLRGICNNDNKIDKLTRNERIVPNALSYVSNYDANSTFYNMNVLKEYNLRKAANQTSDPAK